MSTIADTAVICSSHINAFGLVQSLHELQWQGRIVCLNINRESYFASRWPHLCEVWPLDLEQPDDLPLLLASRLPADGRKVVMFTDERLLPTFARPDLHEVLRNTHLFTGVSMDRLEIVLDRRLFYEFVQQHTKALVPRTVDSSCDPWQEFGKQFRIRVWRSWQGIKKLLRGLNCYSRQTLALWKDQCDATGLTREEWGYQELLSTRPQDNISVCGWHDPDQRFYVTSQRIQVAGDLGWIVKSIPPRADLLSHTASILNALHYSGPFEMEFLYDPRVGVYKVNELNPRFWMQHRLAAFLGDNYLVKRYLGLSADNPSPPSGSHYWLNTDEVLARLVSWRPYQALPYLGKAIWSHPVNKSTIGFLSRRKLHEYTALMKGIASRLSTGSAVDAASRPQPEPASSEGKEENPDLADRPR